MLTTFLVNGRGEITSIVHLLCARSSIWNVLKNEHSDSIKRKNPNPQILINISFGLGEVSEPQQYKKRAKRYENENCLW